MTRYDINFSFSSINNLSGYVYTIMVMFFLKSYFSPEFVDQ